MKNAVPYKVFVHQDVVMAPKSKQSFTIHEDYIQQG